MNDLRCSKISFNIISIKPINHEQRQTKTTRRCKRFPRRNHRIIERHQGRRTGCLRQHARKPPIIGQRLPYDRRHRCNRQKPSLPSRRLNSISMKLPHKNNRAACTGSFVRSIILYLHEPLKSNVMTIEELVKQLLSTRCESFRTARHNRTCRGRYATRAEIDYFSTELCG